MKFMYIIIYNAGFEGKAKGKWEFLKEKKMGRWGPTTWARADSRAGCMRAVTHAQLVPRKRPIKGKFGAPRICRFQKRKKL